MQEKERKEKVESKMQYVLQERKRKHENPFPAEEENALVMQRRKRNKKNAVRDKSNKQEEKAAAATTTTVSANERKEVPQDDGAPGRGMDGPGGDK